MTVDNQSQTIESNSEAELSLRGDASTDNRGGIHTLAHMDSGSSHADDVDVMDCERLCFDHLDVAWWHI